MADDSPLGILLAEFAPEAAEVQAVEKAVAAVPRLPAVKSLSELQTPLYSQLS